MFAYVCNYFIAMKQTTAISLKGKGVRGVPVPRTVFLSMCSFFNMPFLKELLLFLAYLKTKVSFLGAILLLIFFMKTPKQFPSDLSLSLYPFFSDQRNSFLNNVQKLIFLRKSLPR